MWNAVLDAPVFKECVSVTRLRCVMVTTSLFVAQMESSTHLIVTYIELRVSRENTSELTGEQCALPKILMLKVSYYYYQYDT